MARMLSTILIERAAALVALDDFILLNGDKAVIIRPDGTMAIVEAINYFRDGEDARAALEPIDEFTFRRCTIMGRVIELMAA